MYNIIKNTEDMIRPQLEAADYISLQNQQKVLEAFHRQKVSDHHFHPSTGYGYDDEGRDTLERVYADVFKAEAALVRPQIISGTHAITIALFGILRPGDELLYITGQPYDTLASIVSGGEEDTGSLKDFDISYRHVDLNEQHQVDWPSVEQAIANNTKMIAIQRSRGYDNRPSLPSKKSRA